MKKEMYCKLYASQKDCKFDRNITPCEACIYCAIIDVYDDDEVEELESHYHNIKIQSMQQNADRDQLLNSEINM